MINHAPSSSEWGTLLGWNEGEIMIKIDSEYPPKDRLDCCNGSEIYQHSEIKLDGLLLWMSSASRIIPGSLIAVEYDNEGRIKREYSDAKGDGKVVCSTGDYEGQIDYERGILIIKPASWIRRMICKVKRWFK